MTVLEWLTAGSGIAAAVVPAALFLFERRDRMAAEKRAEASEMREMEALLAREHEEQKRADQAHAERVHVWPATRDVPGIKVMNTWMTPATDLTVEAMTYDGTDVPPRHLLYGLVVLPPTADEFIPLSDLLPLDDFDAHEDSWHVEIIGIRSVTFTDANGLRWRRKYKGFATGPLERIAEEPALDSGVE